MTDRSDEIRQAVREARSKGHAAQLRYAHNLLARDDGVMMAKAVIGDVLRDLEPPMSDPRDVSDQAR